MSSSLDHLTTTQEALLLLERFDIRDNGLLVPSALTDVIAASQAELTTALKDFQRRGWVAETTRKGVSDAIYEPTRAGWLAREAHLRENGLRHRSLIEPAPNLLPVLCALLMAGNRENDRLAGGRLGRSAELTVEELQFYLPWVSPDELKDAVAAGFEARLFRNSTKLRRTVGEEGHSHIASVAITADGRANYEDDFAKELRLAPNSSILDLQVLNTIDVFNSWQSEYNSSRSAIDSALLAVVEQINKLPGLFRPLRIVQATAPGDGAVRIDAHLLGRIAAAHLFVADLTPILAHEGRLYPNANVLVEVGYALAGKDPQQILLLSKNRPDVESNGSRLPFDIAHVRRHAFHSQSDLQKRLLTELRTILQNRRWLAT
jgi:hypothetical protein